MANLAWAVYVTGFKRGVSHTEVATVCKRAGTVLKSAVVDSGLGFRVRVRAFQH